MNRLNDDLKNQKFKSIYLLYGEERFLKRLYKRRLIESMRSEEDTINYNYYEGNGINVQEVIDISETLPFFAENRLVVIENSGFFKKATLELADYLKNVPETTRILFVEEEVDKRGKMYKTVMKEERAVEIKKQDAQTLSKWMIGLMRHEGIEMKEKTAQFMISMVGMDMFQLNSEVEKLICYTMGRNEVTIEDVQEVCVTHITNHIFDMVEAVANKNQKRALEYYYDLISLKEAPMRILFLLARQFRLIYQMKLTEGTGIGNAEIAKKLGIQPFVVKKYQAQAKHFTKKFLREILEDAAEIEESVKTGIMADKIAVELFIVKYSAS